MEIRLDNRIALVTGSTSGIGEATARRLAACGARVMLTGRNEQKLRELAWALDAAADRVGWLAGDLTSETFRRRLMEATVQKFGRLDILVNAAGIIALDRVNALDLTVYDRLMAVNLRAAVHLTALAVPYLEKTRGTVVNVSPVAGIRSFAGILSYCISKAGLDQFTRCAALELAPRGIRVNAVNPGVVVTRLHTREALSEDAYARFLEHSKSTHPLGRVGQPEEVADLIAFLVSARAGWITGVSYSIDGGRAQTCAR